MTDYRDRIGIPHDGDANLKLYTKSGEHISTGYTRIVFGGRGPYIEFEEHHLIRKSIYLPPDLKWKLTSNVYYFEFRSKLDYVKLYFQRKEVDYADYKVDKYYISPFELYDELLDPLIESLRKKKDDESPFNWNG